MQRLIDAREIDAPTIDVTRSLYDLWLRAKGDAPMPPRSALGVARLGELTPFVYMIDILDGGADYQIRFMGSHIVQSLGQDFTGYRFSEHTDDKGSWRVAVYRKVYKSQMPFISQVSLGDFDRGHVLTESVILPLADESDDFNRLICAADVVA